jgi:hypothetical protein
VGTFTAVRLASSPIGIFTSRLAEAEFSLSATASGHLYN